MVQVLTVDVRVQVAAAREDEAIDRVEKGLKPISVHLCVRREGWYEKGRSPRRTDATNVLWREGKETSIPSFPQPGSHVAVDAYFWNHGSIIKRTEAGAPVFTRIPVPSPGGGGEVGSSDG